jgi:hypothetical protein
MFQPGGGRGAIYVLVQMALLLAVAWLLRPTWPSLRWFLALCGYICFFTGAPALALRLVLPARVASFQLRVAVLALLPAALVLPDIIYYVLWQPAVFDLKYSARHLLNPIRTLANWTAVEANGWLELPLMWGVTGLLAYLGLIRMGMRMTLQPAAIVPRSPAAAAGEPGSADLY